MDDMVNVSLPGDPRAAARAREELRSLEIDLEEAAFDNMRLLVTELVTNSVRHAQARAVELMVLAAPHAIRIEVADDGPGFAPEEIPRPSDREGGWGLFLVERLADRWGVLSAEGRTRVWCELDR